MAPKQKRPAEINVCLPHDALRDPYGLLFVGAPVDVELVVAKTDDVAVVVRHVSAYPDGFSFVLVIRLRQPDNTLFEVARTLHFNPRRGNRQSPGNIYLRVELADGRSLTPPYTGQHGEEPGLQSLGGNASAGCFSAEFAASLLPTSGDVVFVCDWARYGIVSARAKVPATRLTTAAARAKPLWEVDDSPAARRELG
jgi:hypothetical protein